MSQPREQTLIALADCQWKISSVKFVIILIAERIAMYCNTKKYFGQSVKVVVGACGWDGILTLTFHASVLSGVSWHPHGTENEIFFLLLSLGHATPTYLILLTAPTGCHRFHACSSIVLFCTVLRGGAPPAEVQSRAASCFPSFLFRQR